MKKWNRAASAALVATFVMAGTLPATAAEVHTGQATVKSQDAPAGMISQAQAIRNAREMFRELYQYVQVDAFFFKNASGGGVWNLHFSSKPADPDEVVENFSLSLDGKTGTLMNFQHQNPAWQGDQTPDPTKAKEIATAFLKQYAPDIADRFQADVNTSGISGAESQMNDGKVYKWTMSSITFHEMVHGIPFSDNRVSVEVDQFGHVVGMDRNLRFDSSKLPDPFLLMAPDAAAKAFADSMDMEKKYMSKWFNYDRTTQAGHYVDHPALTYAPTMAGPFDAINGVPIDWFVPPHKEWNEPYRVTGDGLVTAKTKDDAKALVTKLFHLDQTPGTFHENSLPTSFDGHLMWNLSWDSQPTDQPHQGISLGVTFDAATGQLMNFYKSNGQVNEQAKPTFTVEEGKAKAVAALQKFLPDTPQDLLLITAGDDATDNYPKWVDTSKVYIGTHTYSYFFNYAHQGLPISDKSINVQLDSVTGELLALSLPTDWREPLFPDSSQTVPKEVAKQAFLKAHPLHLEYMWPDFAGQVAPEGKLVYVPTYDDQVSYIDALTGENVVLKADK